MSELAIARIADFYATAGTSAQQWRHDADQVHTHAATMCAAYLDTPDGQQIPGLVVQIDYRGEQEHGLPRLRAALCGNGDRDFFMRPDRTDHVAVFDDGGLVLSQRRLAAHQLAWGDPIQTDFDVRVAGVGRDSYTEELDGARRWTSGQQDVVPDPRFTAIAILRARARALGIKPLPRTKRALADAIAGHPDVAGQARDLWPVAFPSGETMILHATGPSPTAAILRHLAGAAAAGRLGMGDASGPFHRGLLLYDVAHETDALVSERDQVWATHDQRMAELGDREQRLRQRPDLDVYFLGRPRAGTWNDERGETRYWLNAYQRRAGYRAPHHSLGGWWTLNQLDCILDGSDWPVSWYDEQMSELGQARAALEAHGLHVRELCPADSKPAAGGQTQRYRFAVKRGNEYVIDEPSATRELVDQAVDDPETAIEQAAQRRAARDEQARRRRAERQKAAAFPIEVSAS